MDLINARPFELAFFGNLFVYRDALQDLEKGPKFGISFLECSERLFMYVGFESLRGRMGWRGICRDGLHFRLVFLRSQLQASTTITVSIVPTSVDVFRNGVLWISTNVTEDPRGVTISAFATLFGCVLLRANVA